MGKMVGARTRDGDQQLCQLGHLNLVKNLFNVIIVGVGHSYKQCLSQGGIDWRTLNEAEVPPGPVKGPNLEKKQ